jgi:hypothetical protein
MKVQTILDTHQKKLLCWCGQRLYFQPNVCFQIITLAVSMYRKLSMTGPNPTIPYHDDRIYTSQQPHLLPQSHSSTVDCCILSNSPLVSTLQTKRYGIQHSYVPCAASLLIQILDGLKVERSMVLVKRPRVSVHDLCHWLSCHDDKGNTHLNKWLCMEEQRPQNGHWTLK